MTADPSRPAAPPQPIRRLYARPVLRVFGTVATMTAAASMTGSIKDGGPNNLKT